MQNTRFPFLATMDRDQPRLRPISPVRVDGFTVYIANLRSYHKDRNMRPLWLLLSSRCALPVHETSFRWPLLP